MSKVKVYNQEGKELESIDLNPNIFDIEVNENLIHEAAVAAMANQRRVYAHAKDRSEVRGGGRKPWRQKGTGRARHGSRRSPIWIGGGVTFGPTKDRNFSVKINKKAKQKAMKMALAARAKEESILVLDELKLEEAKTNKLAKSLKNIPGVERKLLLVLNKPNAEAMRVVRNIEWLRVINVNNLNILDLIRYPKVMFVKPALPMIEKIFNNK